MQLIYAVYGCMGAYVNSHPYHLLKLMLLCFVHCCCCCVVVVVVVRNSVRQI